MRAVYFVVAAFAVQPVGALDLAVVAPVPEKVPAAHGSVEWPR